MKGEQCDYLHQMDTSKMPECKHGTDCDDEDCPFRHVKEEDRIECVFYRQVFELLAFSSTTKATVT